MPDNPFMPQLSLQQLAQLHAQMQQQNMNDPNVTIQPQGRYVGRNWLPFNSDQMVVPFGRPPDQNTFRPEDVMNYRGSPVRQEDL